MSTKWIGEKPTKCDLCRGTLEGGWVDGRTKQGPWANMCALCFIEHGVGLGTGFGQKYNNDGVKVQG